MRILYLLLKITLNYSLRVFYPRIKLYNSPKQFFGRTVYVSNHASAFMDPLAVASLRMPIVFFMTRSDIFNKVTQPILWACHMLPIYRQHDGADFKEKNEAVFVKCTRILSAGRNLLVFGEGFTDDTFIRRLKPLKKGSVKIAFSTLERVEWKKKVYMAAVGCNYSDPSQMRSDLLIATSDKICLNDYKEQYEENPNRVITEVTRLIEQLMQDQITHIEDKDLAPFHEQIMILNRKGMNALSFDRKLSLEKRWRYSQKLAKWLNKQDLESNADLQALREEMDGYFKLLKRFRVQEHLLFWKINNGSRMKEVLMMIVLFPFAIIGAIHCAIPYILVKKFVEKSFKRRVFWSGVKVIGAQLLIAIFNIPLIFVMYYYIYPSWWLAIAYFFSIGLTGLAAYIWVNNFKDFKTKGVLLKTDLTKMEQKRAAIIEKMNALVPSSFD